MAIKSNGKEASRVVHSIVENESKLWKASGASGERERGIA